MGPLGGLAPDAENWENREVVWSDVLNGVYATLWWSLVTLKGLRATIYGGSASRLLGFSASFLDTCQGFCGLWPKKRWRDAVRASGHFIRDGHPCDICSSGIYPLQIQWLLWNDFLFRYFVNFEPGLGGKIAPLFREFSCHNWPVTNHTFQMLQNDSDPKKHFPCRTCISAGPRFRLTTSLLLFFLKESNR